MRKLLFAIISLCLVLSVSSAVTSPVNAVGTTLPSLTSSLNYRVFNDLMKQSLPMVPYRLIYGSVSRYWGYNIGFINGLSHLYPSSLPTNVYTVSEIQFYPVADDAYKGQSFTIKYSGQGTVGVYQSGLYNLTWSNGNGGNFTLQSTSQSLFVYIYSTVSTDPVTNITIFQTSLGSNPSTFTTNFLNYIQPFDLLRTCFWQGQNIYNSGLSLQIWANRTLTTSSTQISSNGVALQHILQLQNYAFTLWPCIPDTADSNYITKFGTLLSKRDQSKIIYMQFGNVYTIMNNIPDAVTNPAFSTFMAAYGATYRPQVLFTINYKDIQYYINAMGMRTSPPINFTYIDAIGLEACFGIMDATVSSGLTDAQLKAQIINMELSYETTVNTAYQLAKMNGTDLVMFSGGPYLKTPWYGWNWQYSRNTSNLTLQSLASQETALYNTLANMTLNDPWVPELYLHWMGRLKSMGIRTLMFSQLVGPFTAASNIVPLLSNLSSTTQIYNAIKQSQGITSNRVTTLPLFGTVPSNPFVCNPACVWGDCVNNTCVCYAGYSGQNCTVYTNPATQNKIGVNLQGLSYWTTQHPFIDMHRQGSAWVYFIVGKGWSSGAAYQNQVPLDANNYPTYLPPGISVGTLMARDVQTHYVKGTYVVLYDGDGILTFGMYDVVAVRYGIGRCELDVVPSTNMNNGILVTITRTNPQNYIRNIRVISPGYEGIWQAVNFNPLMLEKLKPFGTQRFMDWTNTNGQTDTDWNTRTLPTIRTYTNNGVAWEETIRIANTLGKNVWINIPHLATADYIQNLASLFFNKLQPHLSVYVEYSNEVWGSLFPGGQYAQNMGMNMGLAPNDPTQARFCYLGLITNNISTIWRGVFGANNKRLNIIVSTQAVNADTTTRILTCKKTYNYVDGVAIAPYLSINLNDSMTFNDVFANMNAQLQQLPKMIKSHLTYTNNYSLPLLCYQSGQGLVGSTSIQTNLQIGVQTDVRMRSLYLSYFETLFNNSIVLANQYSDSGSYTKYGSWGIFQYINDQQNLSQKWLGVKDYFAQQNLNAIVAYDSSCVNNCSGNGLCYLGICNCYSNFGGSDCANSIYTDYVQCGYLCTFNQGVCGVAYITNSNRYWNCTCLPGYIGAYCSIPVCASRCNYSGTCTAPQKCTCFRGMMGANCTVDCGCGGHGTCNSDTTCLCDSGYFFNSTTKKCEFLCNGLASSNCYGPNLAVCSMGCVYGTCNNGTCNCWPGYSGSNCTTEIPTSFVNPNLGINLAGLSYWSTQHLFKDYFKQSSSWVPLYYPGYYNSTIAYVWNTKQSFPTLANGYPASLYSNMSLCKLILRDIKLRYPYINQTNEYVLLYDGSGVITVGFDATAKEVSNGRIKFTVVPSTVLNNGVSINVLSTNPSNPIQNIRVILARDEYNYTTDLVSDNFMRFMAQFSTIRFMDLMQTNGSPVSEWNGKTLPNQDTQATPAGISIDLLTKLVMRTGRNAWINIPHLASDDYVTKFASYLNANLSNNKIIYVEYSNQVWNAFFAQGKYATAQAQALGLANYHKFYAMRSLQIFNIFSSVFGNNSPRLKFVISYQAVSQYVADQILTYSSVINGTTVYLKNVANVIAGAPYYDCNSIGNTANTAKIASQTPAEVINICNTSFSKLPPILQIENKVSQTYGNIAMATYEAGTSISQEQTIYTGVGTPAATANFIAANRDPDMYGIYKTLLNTYKSNNLTATAPLMLFSSVGLPSLYGSWGVLDYLDQVAQSPTHPKFQAILDFNQGL